MRGLDNRLLEQMYEAYYHELYIYVYSICKNHQAAEDILQDTFLKAILSLPQGHGNMRAWLYRVARNLALNQIKKNKLTSKTDLTEAAQEEEEPLSKLIRTETYQLLYEGIEKLPNPKKEILVMQYFGRLRVKEIAAILQISPENVRVIANRARRELRNYMEERGNDLP